MLTGVRSDPLLSFVCMCVCVRVRPPFPREYSVNNMQGAIPLVIGGWPTKRPMTRAENVPARANEDIEGRNDKNK